MVLDTDGLWSFEQARRRSDPGQEVCEDVVRPPGSLIGNCWKSFGKRLRDILEMVRLEEEMVSEKGLVENSWAVEEATFQSFVFAYSLVR